MIVLLATVFLTSLAGSLHCAGMCGGIVTMCVSGRPVAQRRDLLPHVLYNLGRLVTYASLGAASGALGAAVDFGGTTIGWTRIAMVLAGATMIVLGLAALAHTFGLRLPCLHVPARLRSLFERGAVVARRMPPGSQPVLMGLLTGFLPCGWLYAFVITAAGTGSPAMGALTMTVFWAGTVPIMLGLGVGVQKLSVVLRRHIPRMTAVAMVIVGAVTITSRLSIPAYASDAAAVPQGEALIEHVHSVQATDPPCCDEPSEH